MADNRAFSTGVMNEGGSPVYYEDKKLSERSAVSGAAALANLKFLLANDDTEGFNTAIKAYIDEAIRSALGALADNLDKGTAVSRLLGTDASHDLGSITPANLASVLGAVKNKDLTSSDDILTLSSDGSKYVGWAANAKNFPTGVAYGFYISMSGFRIVFEYNTQGGYTMWLNAYYNTSFSGWKKVMFTA